MKLHGATLWWPIHLSAWRDCMKSPDRCRTGTPPSAETAPQGSISAFRATEDPPSGLLQLLFIQSPPRTRVNSEAGAAGVPRAPPRCAKPERERERERERESRS